MTTSSFTSGGSEYVVSTETRAADGSLRIALCDGTRTWSAIAPTDAITHKFLPCAEFRSRVLEGLSGRGGTLEVARAEGSVELRWVAVHKSEHGLNMRLRQSFAMQPEEEGAAGRGLRTLLRERALECESLQRSCASRTERCHRLRAELAELNGVAARLKRAGTSAPARARGRLELLNEKKRRIRVIDEALDRFEAGGDVISDRDDGSDT